MSATYDDGHAAGVDKARADLATYRSIALGWATSRVQTIDSRPEQALSQYARGYTAGYRATLVGFIHGRQ